MEVYSNHIQIVFQERGVWEKVEVHQSFYQNTCQEKDGWGMVGVHIFPD